MNNKRILALGICILFLGILGGCSTSKDTETSSKSTKETSTSESSEVKKKTKVDKSMNFAQIQKGDYTSLLGEWNEVAVSVNRKDGNGDTWLTSQNGKLSITKGQISNGSMTLQGNILNAGEDETVVFSEEGEYLTVNTENNVIIWNIYFYPKNVEMSEFGEDKPTRIDDSKDRIVIRTSNNNYVQVFQKNDSASSDSKDVTTESKEKLELNLEEIRLGNYSSINGTWQNKLGQIITIENNAMSFTDITGQNEPGEITELRINIPSLNESDGTPKQISYIFEDNKVKAYEPELEIESIEGYIYFKSRVANAVICTVFLPKGVMGGLLGGDIDRDKIVSIVTQNNPTLVGEEVVYYKVNE